MLDNFNSGYTRALLDLQNFFEMNGYAWNKDQLKSIVEFFIANREELRKGGEIVSTKLIKKCNLRLKK